VAFVPAHVSFVVNIQPSGSATDEARAKIDPCQASGLAGTSPMKKYDATILLVDDDADFLMFVERAFRKNGVTSPIHQVYDGEEAIAYMMGEGKYADRRTYEYPTFIMVDLNMPKADGFTVLQHLKGNPEWAIIPAVIFTASADLDDIKKSYMLGASSYHIKPLSQDLLRQQLKTLHDYWMTCETPQVDSTGRQLRTNSVGKLGERFEQRSGETQKEIVGPETV
jgi:CheY-like chemotaxis protein